MADTLDDIVPMMSTLVDAADQYLRPEHYRFDPDRYARNLVYDDEKNGMSLYRLVWEPSRWTPVHDHGTWGGVGVIEDQLEEQSCMRLGPDQSADRHDGIKLERKSLVLLSSGSVSAFVPNQSYIRKTGCAEDRPRCVSLHLSGRAKNSFISTTLKPERENSLTSHTKKRSSGNVIEAIRKSFS